MHTTPTQSRGRRRPALGLALLSLLAAAPGGRAAAEEFIDWTQPPALPRDLDLTGAGAANSAEARPYRIRLFRITPGFRSDPLGVMDDGPAPAADDPSAPRPADDGGLDWVQVSMGPDNPFFDLRRPGDPGGVGYYRVHTQVQLFESPNTGCAMALKAVTPAGREYDGVEYGPTVFSPEFSLFHALDDGTAIQGFVGKHVNLNSQRLGGELNHAVQYGMAVQRPLLGPADGAPGNVYWFVEALGRYRYDAASTVGPLSQWEVLPGLHWQVAPNWWMSGGIVVPVNTNPATNHWQITCSFQF
jgi:hypothetical protein